MRSVASFVQAERVSFAAGESFERVSDAIWQPNWGITDVAPSQDCSR